MGIKHAGLQPGSDHGFLELDSHADIAVLGNNCRIFQETEKTVDVYGYDPSQGSIRRKIVSGVFAYDNPEDGNCTLLIVHQGLHVPTMSNSLIPPYQMRDNDLVVNECPKTQIDEPTINDHAIIIERDDSSISFRIPLMLRGTISAIPVRRPTDEEFANFELERFELTYETPEWDHVDPSREENETHLEKRIQVEVEDENIYGKLQGKKTIKPPAPAIASTTRARAANVYSYEPYSADRARIAAISNTLLTDELASAMKANCHVSSVYASNTKTSGGLTPEQLARNWMIPVGKARRTIEMTTQRGIRTRPDGMVRRFKTNDRMLRYNRLTTTMFTDTLQADSLSRRKNKYAQIFAIPPGWVKAYAIKTKGEAHEALGLLLRDVGAPEKMVMDGSKEQTLGEFRKKARDAGVRIVQTEPYTQRSNYAEAAIRELKKSVRRKMAATNCPKILWDDCLKLEADIMSHTAHDGFALQGQIPEFMVTGQTCDISRIAEFGWYQWIWWFDKHDDFPRPRKTLGRYLGPTRDIGMAMTAKILKINGQVLYRSTFIAVTDDELRSPQIIKDMETFDQAIRAKLGHAVKDEDMPEFKTPEYIPYEEDDLGDEHIKPFPERDEVDVSTYDPFVGAEVLLPNQGTPQTAKVKNRKRDAMGDLIGHAHTHQMLDTRVYDVEFPDGSEASYSANIIAENLLSQCDSEGRQYLLAKHIVGHRKDEAIALKEDDAYVEVNGRKSRVKTTKGYDFCVEWTDGTTTWVPLNVLKEQIPVEVAEYAVTHSIAHEPAFAWWVPWTLKKRDTIISAVNKRYWKRTHKFGIRVPHSVEEALRIDKENGDTKWADAIQKELTNVMVAFKMIGVGAPAPPGHQMIKCHMIFDVKMDNFTYKARMVAGGHTTETPASITYASVVSRDSIRIALTMAALNDLQVKVGDIQNAYLTAPCREKIVTICGPEFGEHQGQTAILVRALYGLKSSGAAFRNHLATCMRMLGYTPCLADPDVWMRPEVRDDGYEYYGYVLLYVDDALVINHDGMKALMEINAHFKMKESSIGDPDTYLGCKLKEHIMPNGVSAWLQSPSKYIQEAVKNAEVYFKDEFNMPFTKKVTSPFSPNYRPELDATEPLDAERSTRYQSDIGILRWIVEIGRIDIITEVSLLASHLAMPRMGHLMQVWHIYAFLKQRHNGCLIFDPSYPSINISDFCDGEAWKEVYGNVKEPKPTNAPAPRGREAVIRVFVDSDHAGEALTRRSRTGYLIYVNMAPILWYSKKQGTVETSVFGAEFVAMKTATEAARGLRYKLRMMGIEVDEPNYIYGDNMSVIHNTQRPESTLKKKSVSICYHFMRESVAMGESLTAHIRSEHNPADICTKIMGGGVKRDYLTNLILHFASNFAVAVTKSLKRVKSGIQKVTKKMTMVAMAASHSIFQKGKKERKR